MNIVHLKYAVEVANAGSVNKAAENLLMGQPNLSRTIKELESSVGITIFERTPKGMVVTEKGEEFLHYARRILNQIDDLEAMYRNGWRRQERFALAGLKSNYISYAFARTTKKVSRDKPVEMFYVETSSIDAANRVAKGDYDLGIVRYEQGRENYIRELLDELGLEQRHLAEVHYVLVMSRNHPMADKENIHFADLAPYMEVTQQDSWFPSLPFSEWKKEELRAATNRRIYAYERSVQLDILADNPETFMWASPFTEDLLERFGLVQRECADKTTGYKDELVFRRDYTFTDIDRVFLDEIDSICP